MTARNTPPGAGILRTMTDDPLASRTPAGANTTRRITVALDGPASSGKSSVGSAVATRLGLRFLDTGLLYRAVAALALRDGVPTGDSDGLVALVGRIALADDGTGTLSRVLLDGEETADMHTAEVDGAVSAVARQPLVRASLLGRQRAYAEDGGIILAGRDIGTVVLPDAPLKVYLDASVEERASRRIAERALDPTGPEAEAVREQLRSRDLVDSTRAVAPLRPADDALVLKTDGVGFDAVVQLFADAILAAEARLLDQVPAPVPAAPPVDTESAPSAAVRELKAKKKSKVAGERRSWVLERASRMDNDQTWLVKAVVLVCRILANLVMHVEVQGMDRVPRTGAVILAANHISSADAVVIGAWLTMALRDRRIHWLGKKELFDIPIFGWIVASGGVHPVDRDAADVEAYRLASRILDAGYVLLVFPEGTRSPTGALQEAKDGVAMLAMRSGAQIIPIGVNNADAVWRKGKRLPSPFPRKTMTVRIGEPFTTADVVPEGVDRRAAKSVATTAIMGRIAELLDPRHRGVYASAVRGFRPPEP